MASCTILKRENEKCNHQRVRQIEREKGKAYVKEREGIEKFYGKCTRKRKSLVNINEQFSMAQGPMRTHFTNNSLHIYKFKVTPLTLGDCENQKRTQQEMKIMRVQKRK